MRAGGTPWLALGAMVAAGLVLSVLLAATRDMPILYAGLNTLIYGALGVWAFRRWQGTRRLPGHAGGRLYLALVVFSVAVIVVRVAEAFSA
ncbi:hypothetical protein V3W47_18105 [Deinococcus sp. YIM 134068]|uniref:hypothetical protein n=1 Tax=Deinococcus lichenicola TaxID=3118910 RepID=UPI002F940AC9